MWDFQPQNLQNAWDILADYIKYKCGYTDILHENYPEALETWGLIIQLYDAYKAKTVQSDLKKQIAAILSRAKMPQIVDGVYNDDMEKIYLKDLLLYISGELQSSWEVEASVDAYMHAGLGARSASRRRSVAELLQHMTMLVDVI
jgi:hypothetical protein